MIDGIKSVSGLSAPPRRDASYIPDHRIGGWPEHGRNHEPPARRRHHARNHRWCDITAIDETNYALQRGIDMVITDHHECSGQAIPNAVAVVDPKRPGSRYPNSGLAGVGVAYKLLCALEGNSDRVLRDYGDLVAIGTVADVMPLTGENRYLVAQGLAQINTRPRPGIRALLHECGAEGRPVTATTIGFTLAPRINAAGRLGKTAVAALLLLTQDDQDADRYAADTAHMKYRNWQIPYTAPQPPEALLRAGYSPLLAVLLALRGYDDAGQARTFLSGGDQSVFDPMLLQDMDKAVARIRAAIERRETWPCSATTTSTASRPRACSRTICAAAACPCIRTSPTASRRATA